MIKSKYTVAVLALLALVGLSACTTPSAADQAAYNASVAADNFEVNRLIVGINLHTGETLFSVQGACSITRDGDLVVTCKEGPNLFKKHYFGLGPAAGQGVTYVSTQLDPVVASEYHTRIILRPTTFIPDFDLDLGDRYRMKRPDLHAVVIWGGIVIVAASIVALAVLR